MGIFDWLFGVSKNKIEGNYKEEKREGLYKSYHKNGQLESEGMKISLMDCTGNGGPLDCQGDGCVECIGSKTRKIGIWKYYYNDGNLKMVGKYQVLRFVGLPIVKTGIWKYYYLNGKLRMEGEYNGYNDKPGEDWDLRCGVWKLYDKTGKLSSKRSY